MQTRNFYILIVSIMIGLAAFWLTVYNMVELGIDPLQNLADPFNENVDEDETVVIIKGNVKEEFELSLKMIKSDKYVQVIDKTFEFINGYGTEWDDVYSGVSLWSILEEEGLLESDAQKFTFLGKDGYEPPYSLSLDLAKDNPEDIILAYELNGEPIFENGPVRSIVDRSVISDDPNSRWAVSNLKYVVIE